MEEFDYRIRQNARDRDRSRSRSPREWKRPERRAADRDRPGDRDRGRDQHSKVRLFVSNIPYDMKWQELKDLFREKVGDYISYAELYDGKDGRPSGSGVVEVRGTDVALKAIDCLHRYEIKGRNMIVREERDKDRQRYVRPGDGGRDGDRMHSGGSSGGSGAVGLLNMQPASQNLAGSAAGILGNSGGMGAAMNMLNMMGGSNLMGMLTGGSLNIQILMQLGIDPATITNQVFVANLDYAVTKARLEEIFKIAGNVIEVELKTDKDGRSRGMGTVRFEHPMEAVQAIALFNQQMLYDRIMGVRMDKWVDPILQEVPQRLPVGLKGMGVGFGSGGQPLLNIAQISNTLTLSALTGQLSAAPMGNLGGVTGNMAALNGLGGGVLGLGGTGLVGGTGLPGNMAGSAGILGGVGSGLGAGSSGSQNIMPGLSSGMSSGGGVNLSMGDSDRSSAFLSSGLTGSGALGALSGSNFSGLSSGLGSLSDVRGGGLDPGLSASSMMGSASSRMGYDRGSDFNRSSSFERSAASYDRADTYSRGDISTVFVKNLPFGVNWQDLVDIFKKCGEVRTAMIKMDNGRSRGMGTVSFYTPDDAKRAVLMMDGARIEGRQIEVRLDKGP